jgi:hypothetical protein
VRGGRERGAGLLPHVGWAGAAHSAHEERIPFLFSNNLQKYRSEINSGKNM